MLTKITGSILAVVSLTACSADTDALRTRAAFDFRCGRERLELTELAAGSAMQTGGRGAIYGVDGCGHRATYIQPHPGIWIMNTMDGNVEKQAPKAAE